MKLLTDTEAAEWLRARGYADSGNWKWSVPNVSPSPLASMQASGLSANLLSYFAAALEHWLPASEPRLFSVYFWGEGEDSNPASFAVFARLLRSYDIDVRGARAHLLFDPSESDILAGLLFLTIAYDWWGALRGGQDWIEFKDDFVDVYTPSAQQLQAAGEIMSRYETEDA